MDIEKLLSINSKLKRRLMNNLENSNPVLYDALGKRVNAHFIATDILRVFLPDFTRLPDRDKPYLINFNGQEFIGEYEAKIILGYDYLTEEDGWSIPAMLKACEGGYGGARTNAYCLGLTHHSGKDCAEIPVAYFVIPKKEHQRLAADPNNPKFKED